ncbi:MAG: HYR domain-containing protein, partial [bacterium]
MNTLKQLLRIAPAELRPGRSLPYLFLLGFAFLLCCHDAANAQSVLYLKGASPVCAGTSTTLGVNVDGGYLPYTVVYSNGVSNFTVTNYHSDDITGDDPITVTPASTTIYSLVSVTFGSSIPLPVSAATVTVTVNPLPSGLNITTNPVAPVCPAVNFTISATATNGSTFQLWNAANTTLIGTMPYTTNISSSTSYYVRAIGSLTPACTTSVATSVTIDNVKPAITCPASQNLNTNAASCSATLPDYATGATVSDNCTASGSIVKTQSPASGTTLSGGHNSTQLVTLTATDASGNFQTCSFTVTVKDNQNPTIACPSNIAVNNTTGSCLANVAVPALTFGDNCSSTIAWTKSGATSASGSGQMGTQSFNKGVTTVIFTATDVAAHTATCSFTVTVTDNEPPAITCPSNISENTAAGVCTKSVAVPDAIYRDNCAGSTLAWTMSGATTGSSSGQVGTQTFNKGVTTIAYVVSDAAVPANTAACQMTVTVADHENPVIVNLPSNIVVSNDNNVCGAVVTWTEPTATDNCTGQSISQTGGPASGSTFPIGTTTITYTATDASSNTSTGSFTVKVNDTQLPLISCPSDITDVATSGTCSKVVAYTAPVGTDVCSGASTTQITGLASGSSFPVGVTTNTFRVTDASGNTASCSFTVTITDTEAPVLSDCPASITQANDNNLCSAAVTWTEPTATDNCTASGSITWTKSHTPGSTFPVGTTTVTYVATDASGNGSSTCSFTVTVNDTQKPVITGCPADITRTTTTGQCTAAVSWTEPTATDNCTPSGSLVWSKSHTPGSTFPLGTTTVTYTATDAALNTSSTCSFTVTVTDNQKPVITGCPSNITANTSSGSCNAVVSWTEPEATDNCTAPGSLIWYKSHTPGSTFSVGTTTVTYTTTDTNGNTSIPCSFTVTVSDNVPPVATCKNATISLNGSGIATLAVSDVNNGSSDNCTASGSLIITLSKTSFNCTNKGANTVVMTVKDAANNQSTCTSTVTVADNTPPVMTATAGTVTSSIGMSTGVCYYLVNGSIFDPVVSDNCQGTVMSYTVSGATTLSGTGTLANQHLPAGASLITWTATDASGNAATSTLSFTKTVSDNLAPVISAKTNQSRYTNTDCGYTAVSAEFDVTVTENCTVTSQTYALSGATTASGSGTTINGIVFLKGTTTVKWVASDGTNASTRTFQVTVTDNVNPTITPSSMSNISTNVDAGHCYATVTWATPVAADNCTGFTFAQVLGSSSGSYFPVGTTPIRYRATDAAGNITNLDFSVIVTDNTPPSISCPGSSFAKTAGSGVCYYTVSGTEFDPTVTDGCTFTLTNSFDNSATLASKHIPTGINAIVWTATDNGGNTSTCAIVVTVTDEQIPTCTQPTGNYARSTDPGGCYYTIPGNEFDLSNIHDNCATNTPTCVVTSNGAFVLSSSGGSLAGKTLDKDADHPYSVLWTLTDASGNYATSAAFTVTVTDNQPPSFVCNGNVSRDIQTGLCTYTVSGAEFDPASLTDNCTGSLAVAYTLDGAAGATATIAGTVLAVGVHPVVWTVTDVSGNTAACNFNVTVVDPVFPTISPTITDQERNAPSNVCFYKTVGTEFNPTVSDNCGVPTLVNNQTGTATLADFEFPVGITVVVWTARDVAGNVTTMQYQVTVHDITPPSFSLDATATKNTSSSACYYTTSGTEFDPYNIHDNCTPGNFSVVNNYNNYKSLAYVQFPTGTTNVLWSVSDYYGNTTTSVIAVTVTDNVLPVITCPGSAYTRVVDQGQSYYTVGTGEFKPAATDNCSFTYINSFNSTSSLNGAHLTAGAHNILWTATDASANVATCMVTVNVVTDLYPAITCVGDQPMFNTTSSCSYTVSGTGFNATSTTAGATLTFVTSPVLAVKPGSPSSLNGAIFPIGTTLVTWTASQTIAGTVYTNTCSFYVVVTDDEHPVITPPADVTLYTSVSSCWVSSSLTAPVVTDNCGVLSITSDQPGTYYKGVTNVHWIAEDIHQNLTYYTQQVTVIDDDGPLMSCPASFCRQKDSLQSYYTVNGHEFDPWGTWDCSGITSVLNNYNGSFTLNGAQLQVVNSPFSVIWTATDAVGNTSTCSISITINSSDPPPVTCRGNEERNTSTGTCFYTVSWPDLDVSSTATAPAPSLTYVISPSLPAGNPYPVTNPPSNTTLAGAVFPAGTYTITWTATSGSDVNTCCSYTLTVHDNQVPVITSWPADISVSAGSGCYATGIDVGTPVATDNCTSLTYVASPVTSGSTNFPIGVTSIYWRVYDTYGNYIDHTQTVTVTDNVAPVITCPADRFYRESNNPSVAYYTVIGTEFTPAVTENCTLSSYKNSKTSTMYLNGTQLAWGDHAILWTATDVSGNTATCMVNVTVVESFHPEISCVSNTGFYAAANACTYTVSGTALDAVFTSATTVAGRTLTYALTGVTTGSGTSLDGVAFNLGTTTVTWTARQTIGGTEYTSTCSHEVVVSDNLPPVINPVPSTVTFGVDPGYCTKTTTLSNPVATDNCTLQTSLIITNDAPSPFLMGTTNVRWEVSDLNGNSTAFIQQVIVNDDQGPVISNCPGSAQTASASGSNCAAVVTWPALISTDACSGVKSFTTNYAPGTLFIAGTTHVVYTATDYKDNVSTCGFDVIVVDADPTVSCVGNKTRSANSGVCSYQVLNNEFDPTAYADNCSIKTVTWSYVDAVSHLTITGSNTLSGTVISRGHGVGTTGQIPITWTVTDYSDNPATCSFILTIQDLEPPNITVPANQVRYVDNNKNYYTTVGTEFDDAGATDNCGIVSNLENGYHVSTLAGVKLYIGVNPIVWYATDDAGNTSQQSFSVTVYDDEPPVKLTSATNTTANTSGSCSAAVNYTAPTFIDYGTTPAALTITISPAAAVPGYTFPVGVTPVTYTVTDSYGNTQTNMFNVTVTDIQNPSITCVSGSPFNKLADNGKAYYSHAGTDFDPTAFSDNCAVTLTNNYYGTTTLSGATFPVGTTPVTWTATDASLNTATCMIEVIVTDDQVPSISSCPGSSVAQDADAGKCYFTIPGSEYDPYGFSDNQGLSKLTYQLGSGAEVGTDLTTTLAGAQIPAGTSGTPTTTVTWRLTDVSANVATCQTVFTVTDPQLPQVVTVSNQTRSTDAGQADYTAKTGDNWNPTVTDNCEVLSYVYQVDGGSVMGSGTSTTIVGQHFAVGTHDVLWTATDIHGNTNYGSYQVTVTDDAVTTIVCNAITVQLSALGNYTLTSGNIAAIAAGSSDPNGIASTTVTPDAFTCSNVGVNPVLLTVTDNYGNAATCSANVTVQDVTPPGAVCQNITIQLDGSGQATILPAQLDNNSTDACGIKSLAASRTSFTCTDFGAIPVILTVTDNNDNTATCTATVTVEDNILPSAVCTPITVYLNSLGTYTVTESDVNALSAGSTDNCVLVKTVTPSTFDCSPVGANAVTLRVTDPRGNFVECSTTITVVDNIAPEVHCQDITVPLDGTGHATITASQIDNGSTDACGIATRTAGKTAFTCADKGPNTVMLTVTDVNGNAATCNSTVTIADVTAPAITCVPAKAVNTDNNVCTYTHAGTAWNATATDGCTTIASLTYALSGVTSAVTVSNTTLAGQVFNKGTTTVLWTATDASGNTATCSFTVNVTDAQVPTALCQNLTIQLDATGNAGITADQANNGSSDNCGIQGIAVSKTAFTCADRGVNQAVFTVTDLSGNTATCPFTVTVQDLISPVAQCKDITVQLNGAGSATITGTDVDNGSTDNCSITARSVSQGSFSCSNVGTPVVVVLTVSDAAGNTASCSSTVTVEDHIAPTANCKNISVSLDGSGNASITADDINNVSSDACGILSLAASKTSFTCADRGPNTVILTVTDVNSNVATCNSTVTVNDVIKPTITYCPGNQSVNTATGACTYTHGDDTWNATATDICGVTSLTYVLTGLTTGTGTTLSGVTLNKGITTVTWTASDASLNSQTCAFTVTVTDNQDPVAICKTATVYLDRTGNITVVPADIDNTSTDNCAITTYKVSKDGATYSSSVSYACADIGSPVIYLQVTDAALHTSTCSTTVTIADNQGPTVDADDLTNLANVTDNTKCYYTHTGTGWDPTDNCGTVSSLSYELTGATTATGTTPATLNNVAFNKGTTLVTWTATDNNGNTATTAFSVVVTDNQDPAFTACSGNITQSVSTAGDASATVSTITAPTYSDNCAVTGLSWSMTGAGVVDPANATGTVPSPVSGSANPLNNIAYKLGTTTVKYTVTDAAARTATCSFLVTINAQATNAVTVTPLALTTTEATGATHTATFTVNLTAAPTGTVKFDVVSSDETEGTVSTSLLTFNAGNYSTPQTVTVTGVNEYVQDGNITYPIYITNNASTDPLSGYKDVNPDDVYVTNIDNDMAGVTVSAISNPTSENLATATFTMKLNSQPTDDVSFTLACSDATEGEITSTTTLTFTSANWNTNQTVTVRGKNDLIVDGTVAYSIGISNGTSTDVLYNNLFATSVAVTNTDNDVAGITVTPVSLTTTEASGAGNTAAFTVVLTSKPATDVADYVVVVDVASNDATEGTVSASSLTFTAADWNVPQTVTVTGVDDLVVDGNITYSVVNTVNTSGTTDPNYDPLNPADVSVTNTDNDAATLAITDVSQDELNSGTSNFVFTVTQSGADVVGSYTVTWYTQNGSAPAATQPSDYTGDGGTLTFTGGSDKSKTISIVVKGETKVEQNETFKVVLSAISTAGKNITISDNTGVGTILNDDGASFSINDVSISEGNSGTQALTFTATLSEDIETLNPVTIDYTTTDATATTADADYVVKSGTLSFTGTRGETKTVSVTVNGDQKIEMNETFNVVLSNILCSG